MKTGLTLLLLLTVLATVPGCAKFRKLTRRDYASLDDPFVDKSSLTADTKKDADKDEGSSGFAKLDSTQPAIATAQPATAQPATADPGIGRATVAKGNTPTFGGVRAVGMSNVIASDTDSAPDNGPSLEDFVTKAAQPATSSLNAATDAVAKTSVTPDTEEFAAFLGEQAEASGLTETAHELDAGFADWANSKKKEWKQKTAQAENQVAATVNPIRQVSQGVTAALAPTVSSSASSTAVPESAVPLIQHTTAATQHKMPEAISAPPVARPLRQGNPFADQLPEFPEMDAAVTAPPPTQTAAAAPAIAPPATPPATPRTRLPGSSPPAVSSVPAAAATGAAAKTPATQVEEPWDPFAAFDGPSRPPTTQPSPVSGTSPFGNSTAAQSGGQTLDSGFRFDSGWKPSNMERP
ncbi:MAG: hypothetical protein R3C59_17310 [Planctomycetaceae bacterium]